VDADVSGHNVALDLLLQPESPPPELNEKKEKKEKKDKEKKDKETTTTMA